jgi:hypothetical protein
MSWLLTDRGLALAVGNVVWLRGGACLLRPGRQRRLPRRACHYCRAWAVVANDGDAGASSACCLKTCAYEGNAIQWAFNAWGRREICSTY